MIRIVIVDDHGPTREAVLAELGTAGVTQIVGQAETSDEALKVSQKLLPDIVLLDTHMPGLITTADLVKRLTTLRNVRVIIFAGEARAAEVQDLLEAGACGYVLKTDPPALIRMSILMVHRGTRPVISPSLPRHITRLTTQERNVLRQLTQRGPLSKAAQRMDISEAELEQTLEQLASKLDLSSSALLVKWAKKHGF